MNSKTYQIDAARPFRIGGHRPYRGRNRGRAL